MYSMTRPFISINTIKYFVLIIACALAICTLTIFKPASAGSFNAGRIIDDSIFTNYGSMNSSQIQAFLNSKVPVCDTYGTQPSEYGGGTRAQWGQAKYGQSTFICLRNYSEGGRSAAQIIYDTAQKYQINPQVLIVLLQKEQGLITDTWPLNIQYRTATGYGCPDTAPCDSQYYGLTNQLDWSGKMFRAIMNASPTWYTPYILGNNYIRYNPNASCGGSYVNIVNRSTQALYNYTPYQPNSATLAAPMGTTVTCGAYGNLNFYRYFSSWFGDPVVSIDIKTSNIYISDGIYRLNTPSGRSLDVSNIGTTNGTNVQIWDQNATGAQYWQVTGTADGFYTLKNPISGKYLDVDGAGIANGTNVQIWESTGSCAQKWALVTNGDGYNLLSACSGRALDLSNGGTSNGTNVQIWDRNSSNAQRWKFASIESLLPSGLYTLSVPSTKLLDISGAGTVNGTKTQIWDSNGLGAQYWQVTDTGDGFYMLKNPLSGKYLDVDGAKTANATRVQIWEPTGSCAQKWALSKNGNDRYYLLSACSGRALDVSGNVTAANGTQVQIWDRNNYDAQKWKFNPYSQAIQNGLYRLVVPEGKSLDISGASTTNGTQVQIWEPNSIGAQYWQVTGTADGFYTLRNPLSGKLLDLDGAKVANGTRIQIWSDTGSCAQKWIVAPNGDNSYYLLSACYIRALDVSGGRTTVDGTKVQLWDRNTTNAQKWEFMSID